MRKAGKQNEKEIQRAVKTVKESGGAQQAAVRLYACRGRCRSTYVCGDV